MAPNMLRLLSNTGPGRASLQWGRLALGPRRDVKNSRDKVIQLHQTQDESLYPDKGAAAVM